MGLWHMREGTPWMKLLERLGTSRMQKQSSAAIKAYLEQVDGFLPLDPKDRPGWRRRPDANCKCKCCENWSSR